MPLAEPLSQFETADLAATPIVVGTNGPKPRLISGKTVINLASLNFTGLGGRPEVQEAAQAALRRYGVGACGPPGFYGTFDVHMQLERDIADYLGTESAIIYSQDFSTISSVIPAFCKRGDYVVVDRGVNFAIRQGVRISRANVRWYDHNDLNSLRDVLENLEKERRRKGRVLTRRFIITEGIFERDGTLSDLPRLVCCYASSAKMPN